MSDSLFILAVLFMMIVAPLWILFHYLTKWRAARSPSTDDGGQQLAELWENAERMEQRIQTLERILDAEAPGWRNRI